MIKEIMERALDIGDYEQRDRTEESCEIVIREKDTQKWQELLREYFGPAVKSRGEKASKKDKEITEEFGGIWQDQTLFIKSDKGKMIIAMLWPWQSGENTTLKISVLKREKPS